MEVCKSALMTCKCDASTYDLLDDVSGRVEVDETLVDSHLVSVPGLGTLTTRRLSGRVLEDLGGESDGALDSEVSVLGSVDEVRADWG
jgi:hypothetical protein